jgi:nicotinamide-nucleotide amidase
MGTREPQDGILGRADLGADATRALGSGSRVDRRLIGPQRVGIGPDGIQRVVLRGGGQSSGGPAASYQRHPSSPRHGASRGSQRRDRPVRSTAMEAAPSTPRRILTAELLAVGTELTVGETLDTNSGELARSLVAYGVTVGRTSSLPDDLAVVVDALRTALTRADLVVTTGGLGPTPDDLTREAVAAVCGEEVTEDPATIAWLEGLWARRGIAFPSVNRKQAWLIPSATGLPNPNGTAPGWWVDRPDGRVIAVLPGPPREMRPMWTDHVLPRLVEHGVGTDLEVRTFRLHGIGESQVAELLGEPLLRASNPVVATYARHEAVDVRVSARDADGRRAADLADEAEAAVLAALGRFVWARGTTSWAEAIDAALAAHGWTLATAERGTGGALVALLRATAAQRHADVDGGEDDPTAQSEGGAPDAGDRSAARERVAATAERLREQHRTDVGCALEVLARGSDLRAFVGVATPGGTSVEARTVFQRGGMGADWAAIAAAAVLLESLSARFREAG